MTEFIVHHTAISVADADRSVKFYEYFGFREILTWQASDDSLSIVHLMNDRDQVLEIVCYAKPEIGPIPGVGNDLDRVGVKHMAFHVDDVEAVRDDIAARGLGEVTEITHGRTQMDLFFVRDPDGLWVEVLTDDRKLDSADPVVIHEDPRLLEGE
jgi:catechol 2,3-dioxygenase-like lactoylglutathione lyase family enzyme